MRMTSTAAVTLAFGLCVTFAGLHSGPAAGKTTKAMKAAKKPMPRAGSNIAHGKTVAESNGCNTCHKANYAGKKAFSPSIRANGITAKYTAKTWERVMSTGETEDGGHVMKPMPVYHMAAKDSAPLYAFLKSLK